MSRRIRSDDTSPWPFKTGSGTTDQVYSTDTTLTNIAATCTATIDTYSVSATNPSFAAGQMIFIMEMRGASYGKYEFNYIASYVAGTITTFLPTQNTYASAQVIVFPQYRNWTIDTAGSLTPPNWSGITGLGGIGGAFVNGQSFINGTLNLRGTNGATATNTIAGATGLGFSGGEGLNSPNDGVFGHQGEGTLGFGTHARTANNQGGGGGRKDAAGENTRTGGAGGGSRGAGSNGAGFASYAGIGGNLVTTTADLTDIALPGGGGGGCSGGKTGSGASGSGIFILVTANLFIHPTTGSILGRGGTGGGGSESADTGGGGGGGAIVLIKCGVADIGEDRMDVRGGAGGSPGSGSGGGQGGNGQINIDYVNSVTGSVSASFGNYNTRQDNSLGNKGMVTSFLL